MSKVRTRSVVIGQTKCLTPEQGIRLLSLKDGALSLQSASAFDKLQTPLSPRARMSSCSTLISPRKPRNMHQVGDFRGQKVFITSINQTDNLAQQKDSELFIGEGGCIESHLPAHQSHGRHTRRRDFRPGTVNDLLPVLTVTPGAVKAGGPEFQYDKQI